MISRDRHLGEAVHDYVDGTLTHERMHQLDLHLVTCGMCRCQVEQERALVESLRAFRPDPGRQQDLVAGLLGLAAQHPIPQAPVRVRREPNLVMHNAPPQYHSARRSVACAMLAVAGCFGAALVVVNVPARVQTGGQGGSTVPAAVQLNPARAVPVAQSNVVPAAVARADEDARAAVLGDQVDALVVGAAVRVP